jgi:hypothetical protein
MKSKIKMTSIETHRFSRSFYSVCLLTQPTPPILIHCYQIPSRILGQSLTKKTGHRKKRSVNNCLRKNWGISSAFLCLNRYDYFILSDWIFPVWSYSLTKRSLVHKNRNYCRPGLTNCWSSLHIFSNFMVFQAFHFVKSCCNLKWNND